MNESDKFIAPVKKDFLVCTSQLSKGHDSMSLVAPENQTVENVDANTTEQLNEKKPRLRGQNKDRPRNRRIPESERLCSFVAKELDCIRGDACKFMHDVKSYLQQKPEDVGDKCYNFEAHGFCSFGVTCMFSKQHIDTTTLKNIRKPDYVAKVDIFERNKLSNDLQTNLRKRRYSFSSYNEYEQINGRNGHGAKKAVTSSNSEKSSVEPPKDCSLNSEVISTFCDEPRKIDFAGKLYLAPLTTVGNLPFRRICVEFGAEVTCSEMALTTNLLRGTQQEWALMKRHSSEKLFGVQLCDNHVDSMSKCAELLVQNIDLDFIDLNLGCPIELICSKGSGAMLMKRSRLVSDIVAGIHYSMGSLRVPITIKMRTGVKTGSNIAHSLISYLKKSSNKVSLFTIHGRSREQRYTKTADWSYVDWCAKEASPIPLFGCGDILSYEEYYQHLESGNVSGTVIARGALIKPWIFTEIKEKRHWDISAGERLEILQRFVNYGLEHWGSDSCGVDRTRRFLLEWLSFLYRYIPVGLLERLPQKINERPPKFFGRNDLETLMASPSSADWIRISDMLLGPVPQGFEFLPKHNANAYSD